MNTKRVLIISALDPSGGAGLLMDLRAVSGAGAEGLAAVSALTVQGPRGVRAVHPVSDEILIAQIETLAQELTIGAVKIGALGSAANVKAVSAFLHSYPQVPVVLDPVIKPTHGVDLMPREALVELRRSLFELSTVITPNRHEAEELSGIEVKDAKSMRKAALTIMEMMGDGDHWVLVKGGHLPGNHAKGVMDTLVGPGRDRSYRGKRRPGSFRGTGCALASAIAAGLAKGLDVPESVAKARKMLLKWMDKAKTGKGPTNLKP